MPKQKASKATQPTKPVKQKKIGEIPFFPKINKPHPVERVQLTAPVQNLHPDKNPIHQVYSSGVCIEVCLNQSQALDAIKGILPRLDYQHYLQHPTGRRQLIASRPLG